MVTKYPGYECQVKVYFPQKNKFRELFAEKCNVIDMY